MKRVSFDENIKIHEFYKHTIIKNNAKKEQKTFKEFIEDVKYFFQNLCEEIKYKMEYLKFRIKKHGFKIGAVR